MKVIYTISELKSVLDAERQNGNSIGLVPTMGALHEGHASLVRRSVSENEVTVVSIFVNPTQFNDKNDLNNYPRSLHTDCELLDKDGADYVFAPSVEEMYPDVDTRTFDFSPLDKVMEGAFRPGHFNGVAQIVSKLFDIVNPDRAYFGDKDFQQLAVIRQMSRQLNMDIEIIGCPIVREEDGLALSSRNALLTQKEKKIASNLSRTLFKSRIFAVENSLETIRQYVLNSIESVDGLRIEYFEIVDGNTLQPVQDWKDSNFVVGCLAAYCGKIRLIDNIKYKE